MKFETRMDEDGKIVLRLGMTHEAGFPVEPDIDTIVNGVQLLVEAVCGISVFELTRAVIEEYAKNGKPPEGWTNVGDTSEEDTSVREPNSEGPLLDIQQTGSVDVEEQLDDGA